MKAYKLGAVQAAIRGGKHLGSKLNYENLRIDVQALMPQKIIGNNSTFDGAGNWVTGLNINPDITTYPGAMFLNIQPAMNCGIKLLSVAEVGKSYLLAMRVKVESGVGTVLSVGFNFTATNYTYIYKPTITNTEYRWFYKILYGQQSGDLWVGVELAKNNGTKFLIDEIKVDEFDIEKLYNFNLAKYPKYYTNGLFSELSKSSQSLLEFNVFGDSILANPLGTIPVANDEGVTLRPPMLISNNVARRLYDDIKYNPPVFKRLDNAGWTKSGTDFSSVLFNITGEVIHRSVVPNSYCEITVPDGMSDCIIIYRKAATSLNSVECDNAIAVTLNGGDISTHGEAIINTYRVGTIWYNQLSISHYKNLPSGANNTIRLTKSNTTKSLEVWGSGYWSGNSMILKNYSTGGWPMGSISAHAKSLMEVDNLHNWLIEFPNMNNSDEPYTALSQFELGLTLINAVNEHSKKSVFITTHPFGTDPKDGTPNYYETYNTPITFRQRCTMDIVMCVITGNYFIDLFRYFDADIKSRGGTTEGGFGGIYYTSDGQHLDEEGIEMFFNYLESRLPEIPN